jgi:hypothetical protein
MQQRRDNFANFVETMRGKRLLHLGHRDADCDALGSAYAIQTLLGGELGFSGGLKASAADLADWLEIEPLIDPDPQAYDYLIIYDTASAGMLPGRLPERYALFDHHLPGGFRNLHHANLLASQAEWAWLTPIEATCSIVAELLLEHGVQFSKQVAVALAAGIVTDTNNLRLADAAALSRLAAILAGPGLLIENVMEALDNPRRSAQRRQAILSSLCGLGHTSAGNWNLLVGVTDSHDNGFELMGVLHRLGGDLCLVGFPKGEQSMVMLESHELFSRETHLDLRCLAQDVAQQVNADESWGTPLSGRIRASMPLDELVDAMTEAVRHSLEAGRSGDD